MPKISICKRSARRDGGVVGKILFCSRWQESEVAPTKTLTMSIDAAALPFAAAVALLLPLLMLAPLSACVSVVRRPAFFFSSSSSFLFL